MKRIEFYVKNGELYLKLYKERYLPIICKWGGDNLYYNINEDSNAYDALNYLCESKNIVSRDIAKYIKIFYMPKFVKYIENVKKVFKEYNDSNANNMYFVIEDYEPQPISCAVGFSIGSITTNIDLVLSLGQNNTTSTQVSFIPHPKHKGLYVNANDTIEKDFEDAEDTYKMFNVKINDKTYISPNSLFKTNLRQFIIDEFNKIKDKDLDSKTYVTRHFCEDIEEYTGEDDNE